MSVTDQILNYQSFILRIRSVLGGENLLKALFTQAEEEWGRSVDIATGRHFIKDAFANREKSDACRIYIAKLVKLHMNSMDCDLTAWSKETLSSENATNVSISNRISAIEFKSNRELFMLVTTRLLGYDDMVVKFVLSSDNNERAKLLVDYVSCQYNLAQPGIPASKSYTDQTVAVAGLLKTKGFTPELFTDLIVKGVPLITDVSNFWDVFGEIVDESGLELNKVPGSEELYDELSQPTVGADGTKLDLFTVEIDPDDADVETTVEMCAAQYPNLKVVLPADIEYDQETRNALDALAEKLVAEGQQIVIVQAEHTVRIDAASLAASIQ